MLEMLKGRILLNSKVMQDFCFGLWPATASGEEINPNQIFYVEVDQKASRFKYKCTAPGFGQKGNYGNGAIDAEQVIFI